MYARITTADGDFNETCDVSVAGAMVAFGLLRHDGEATPGEHCYTVADDDAGAVRQFIAEWRWVDNREKQAGVARNNTSGHPGYPGPCPEGMDWSDWLAMNNVD